MTREIENPAAGSSQRGMPKIEPVTKTDFDAIIDSLPVFWGERDPAELHHPMFIHEFGDGAFLIRDEQDAVAAYLFGFFLPQRRLGYVHLVAVREDQREKGFARLLYERFRGLARERGCERIKAIARPNNAASIAFHRAMGMEAVEVPDYSGPGRPRVVFSTHLGAPTCCLLSQREVAQPTDGPTGEEWTADEEKVRRYLGRADEFPHRLEGESVLLAHVPSNARRILDLGTGDGRLLSFLQTGRNEMHGVGLDFSELMLEAARGRFAEDERIELVKHDLAEPLPALGRFDAAVSSFAIHHLEHQRKRSLYGEVFELLEPGGVFANFEHVASPTPRLHLAFFEAIDEPIENEDPSDRLLDVETQLGWLRELGFEDVDCYWKWLEMALLIGVKPT